MPSAPWKTLKLLAELRHSVPQVHSHLPAPMRDGSPGSSAEKLPLPGEEEEKQRRKSRGEEQGRGVRGRLLIWEMWVSIWWGTHGRWGHRLREGRKQEGPGRALTWA